ncbi:MAG: GNAT family N-acetyltransferase [Anaerolineaceae bacterium]|jgi:aminoglycoside 6'-N-acetyltransferase I
MDFSITNLASGDEIAIQQTAGVLVAAFPKHLAWSHMEMALKEVIRSISPPGVSRVAQAKTGTILGWIGAVQIYEGRVWEIHPLAVHPACQMCGIGQALVADIEVLARERGELTLWVGADYEDNRTSLGGTDLYPNPLEKLAAIHARPSRRAPLRFLSQAGIYPDGCPVRRQRVG